MSWYTDQLSMPQWQMMRLRVMERDRAACVACGADDKCLNVHHRRYVRGRRPWEYPMDDLETLCEDCHETRHWPGDIDVRGMGAGELRDLIAFAIEREDAADTDRERQYMAAKQSQAWRELFAQKDKNAVV